MKAAFTRYFWTFLCIISLYSLPARAVGSSCGDALVRDDIALASDFSLLRDRLDLGGRIFVALSLGPAGDTVFRRDWQHFRAEAQRLGAVAFFKPEQLDLFVSRNGLGLSERSVANPFWVNLANSLMEIPAQVLEQVSEASSVKAMSRLLSQIGGRIVSRHGANFDLNFPGRDKASYTLIEFDHLGKAGVYLPSSGTISQSDRLALVKFLSTARPIHTRKFGLTGPNYVARNLIPEYVVSQGDLKSIADALHEMLPRYGNLKFIFSSPDHVSRVWSPDWVARSGQTIRFVVGTLDITIELPRVPEGEFRLFRPTTEQALALYRALSTGQGTLRLDASGRY